MRKEIHYLIVDKIASELKLDPKQHSLLRRGCILPDKWQDYPHHYGKSEIIRRRIIQARKRWIYGDIEAFRELGVAFHYITDHQGLPSKYKLHDAFEQKMLNYQIIAQPIDIPEGKERTLNIATYTSRRVDRLGRYHSNPEEALNVAYSLCYMVTRSVLSDPNPPPDEIPKLVDSWVNFRIRSEEDKLLGLGFIVAPLGFVGNLFLESSSELVISLIGALVGFIGCLVHAWISIPLFNTKPSGGSQIVALCKFYHKLKYPIWIWMMLGILGFIVERWYVVTGIVTGLIAWLLRWNLERSIHPDIRDNYDWYRWDWISTIAHDSNFSRQHFKSSH